MIIAEPPAGVGPSLAGSGSALATTRGDVAWPEPRHRPRGSAIRASRRGLAGDTIDLGLGEPRWGWTSEVRQALDTRLAGHRRWGYGPHSGDPELRARIASRERARIDEVVVTTGAQGALFALTRAFLGPGDVALVPDPGFPAYPELVRQAGALPVPYRLTAASGFRLDADALLAVLEAQPRARMVILNHPSNPTGATASQEALEAIVAACRRRRILLVSDEVYRDLYRPGGEPSVGLRQVDPTGVVVGSMSKAWAAPGLRVGWLVAPEPIAEACREVHAWAVTAAAGPSQVMASALLDLGDGPLVHSRRQLELRWREVESVWRSEVGGPPPNSGDGLYLWLALPASAEDDPLAFCTQMREQARVVGVPGCAFGRGGRGYVRFSLGGPVDEVEEGLRRWIRAGGVES